MRSPYLSPVDTGTAIFLEEVDPQTKQVIAHVGIVGDMRTAIRRRAAEADARGIPESHITFSSAKES